MMVCCELCGIGDDLDEMFQATIMSPNGNATSVFVCEGCAKDAKNGLLNVVSVRQTKAALDNSK